MVLNKTDQINKYFKSDSETENSILCSVLLNKGKHITSCENESL